jgi:hypothetical protein
MESNKNIHQYEPLRVPKNWGTEERKVLLQLTDILDDIYRRYGRLRFEDMGQVFRDRIVESEDSISTIEQTATNILLEVGTDKVYRAASEAILIAELGARTPQVEMAVDLIWYDTTNKLMKRCTAVGPPIVWENVQADEVHTSYIDIQDNSIDIGSTGEINIDSGGKLNLASADDLVVSSGTSLSLYVSNSADGVRIYYSASAPANPYVGMMWLDSDDKLLRRCTSIDPLTWVVIQADEVHTSYIDIADNSIDIKSTGEINVASGGALNISSGGSLNLSAASQITIGTKPMEVGGTNLCSYSAFIAGFDNGGEWQPRQYVNSNIRIYQQTIPATPNTTYTIKIGTSGYRGWIQETGENYVVKIHTLPEAGTPFTFTTIVNTDNIELTLGKPDDSIILPSEAILAKVKLEKGSVATDWSPAPEDPASGVVNSSIIIDSDGIEILSGGDLIATAPGTLNIKGGTGAGAVGMSNDTYFLWAGSETASSAPFRVSMAGSVVATKIQQEYSQSFWDMADASYPAEFPLYIPSGYTIDTVAFTFKTNKARTFAKGALAGGGQTSSSGGAISETSGSGGGQTSSSGGGATVTSADGGGSTVTSDGIGTMQTGNSSDELTTDGATSTLTTDGPSTNSTSNDGGHSHGSGTYGVSGTDVTGQSDTVASHTHTLYSHTHGFSHEHYIGVHNHLLTSHTHSVTVAAHSHSVTVADHTHTVEDHTHSVTAAAHTHTVDDHTHNIDYGINEKAELATSCVLKANGTTIGTYSPDPASPVEIKTYMSAGWNTVTVTPNDDARIAAYVLVKLTPVA